MHTNIPDIVLQFDFPGISGPKHYFDPVLRYTRFLKNGCKWRSSPTGIAYSACEERKAVVTGALYREDDILFRSRLDICKGQTGGILHKTADSKGPIGWVNDGTVKMENPKKTIVGRDPRIKILPVELVLHRFRHGIGLPLVQPWHDLLVGKTWERQGVSGRIKHRQGGDRG